MQEKMHEEGNYGSASIMYAPVITAIINKMGVRHLLDYGCGSMCNLAKSLKVDHKLTYQAYDPGVPRFSKEPLPAEMVACVDVLEHIEPEYLESVLNDLCMLTEGIVFLSICTAAALKTLPDGRNAHLTQQPMKWWLPKLWDRWDLQTVQVSDEYSFFIVGNSHIRMESTNGEIGSYD